jgi:RND family efflux transporter MFP subunit
MSTPSSFSHRGRKTGFIGIAAAIAITAAMTVILHARVALSEDPQPKTLLTVAAVPFHLEEGFQRPVSYLGLVVAGRKAILGFEIPGLISTLPMRQGSPVSRGDVIATLDQRALLSKRAAAQAELEQARTELELAQLKANRQSDLRETGAVSKEAFDETRLRAQALLSRRDGVTAKLTSIDIELEKTTLVAPYDGIIADRFVHPGAVVTAGTPVVSLLESANQEAHIGVAASRTEQLEVGSHYPLKLRDTTFIATLLSIRPDVDPVTRAATAVFAIPPDVNALDGEPVTLELDEAVRQSGGWLPIASLLEGKRGVWTVLKLEADGDKFRTVREAVEVLETQEDQAFVRGTLPADTHVVASGVHRISPGTLVAIERVN